MDRVGWWWSRHSLCCLPVALADLAPLAVWCGGNVILKPSAASASAIQTYPDKYARDLEGRYKQEFVVKLSDPEGSVDRADD